MQFSEKPSQEQTQFLEVCHELFNVWAKTSSKMKRIDGSCHKEDVEKTPAAGGGFFRRTIQYINTKLPHARNNKILDAFKQSPTYKNFLQIVDDKHQQVVLETNAIINDYDKSAKSVWDLIDYDAAFRGNNVAMRIRDMYLIVGKGTVKIAVKRFIRPEIKDKSYKAFLEKKKIQKTDDLFDNYVLTYQGGKVTLSANDASVPMTINRKVIKSPGTQKFADVVDYTCELIMRHIDSIIKQPNRKKYDETGVLSKLTSDV